MREKQAFIQCIQYAAAIQVVSGMRSAQFMLHGGIVIALAFSLVVECG
jgi:hypothetical protein